MKEVWKDIPEYEGLYEVSNTGIVRSKDRITPHGRFRKSQILSMHVNHGGYLRVALCKDSKKKFYSAHRLVALSFFGIDENKTQVNHKNGIKTDNRVDNLEWVTLSENMEHAYKTGLACKKGEQNHNRKLTNKDVLKIRHLRNAKKLKHWEIAKILGVTRKTVGNVLNGITWTHV
jgi:predicted XRE-type DNA-binding protein